MRVTVVVEGQTEEQFVKGVLMPHLAAFGVYVSTSIVGKVVAQRRGHSSRGGGFYGSWRRDLRHHLSKPGDDGLRVTTLFDLYGLPTDFPGLDSPGSDVDTRSRCDALQAALAADINDRRFIPYVQRHEFEALVLASLDALEDLLDAPDDLAGIEALRADIGDLPPEDVNDSRETAPSKRLMRFVPSYQKTLYGPLVTEVTGLPTLRAACPGFDAWVGTLEALGATT